MKEMGSGALALTAALITSSTFLPRACSSMYSWMLMLSFGEDRIGAVRRLVRRVVMGRGATGGAEKQTALIMNAGVWIHALEKAQTRERDGSEPFCNLFAIRRDPQWTVFCVGI